MKRQERHLTDNPYVKHIEDLEIVEDFLPPPQDLAKAAQVVTIKVPFEVDALEFYRSLAQTHRLTVKEVIKRVLDDYRDCYSAKVMEKPEFVAAD